MYKDLNDYELIYMIREKNIEYDLLLNKYDVLVKTICNKYIDIASSIGIDYSDLYNIGLNALAIAINKYNEQSSLFYTYASICIKSKIINYLRTNSGKRRIVSKDLINYEDLESGIYLSPSSFIDYTNIDVIKDSISDLLKDYLYSLDYKLMPIFELYINGFNNKEISILLGIGRTNINYYIKKFKSDLKVLLS